MCLRVLYCGDMWEGGTCYSRMLSLKSFGVDVIALDTMSQRTPIPIPKVVKQLEYLTNVGPESYLNNRALIASYKEHKPDIVWIDKGTWLWSNTLKKLRSLGAFIVQHNTDAMWPKRIKTRISRRGIRNTVSLHNVFFTTNIDDFRRFRAQGHNQVEMTDLGYDHKRFTSEPLSPELAEEWSYPLIFVGHHEAATERWISKLNEGGLPINVFGYNWKKSALGKAMGDRCHDILGDKEYEYALKGARLALCFVSEMNYNQTASRSFEIPGSGTFLLATRTEQHLDCYREGEEAEFFSTPEELLRKARHYLEHDEEREAIARRGYERCTTSGYSWDAITRRDWDVVVEIYTNRTSR